MLTKRNFIETKSCQIHRYTLVNGFFCWKCGINKKCKFIYPELFVHCEICYSRLDIPNECCKNCLQCNLCLKFNRLPGYCIFCSEVFNPLTIMRLYKQNPGLLLMYLFDQHFDFLIQNATSPVEKGLIAIILSYL